MTGNELYIEYCNKYPLIQGCREVSYESWLQQQVIELRNNIVNKNLSISDVNNSTLCECHSKHLKHINLTANGMNKVHVILELKSEDYHGTYKEIVAVYSNEEDCKAKLKELEEENHYYNIEYWHEVFNVL